MGRVGDEQILTTSIPFSNDKIASCTQDPVYSKASRFKTLVRVIRSALAVAPILDVELLALSKAEKGNENSENWLDQEHIQVSLSSQFT